MKKFISLTLCAVLCLSLFAGCGTQAPAATEAEETTAPVVDASNLKAAKEYLFTMYKNAPETTAADYTVVGVVVIGTDHFDIQWTADTDTIQFVYTDDKMVTVDVDEENPEEVQYTLTATLQDAAGNTESVSFRHKVPAALVLNGMSYEEIVDAAYTLEDGLAMQEPQRLYGVVTSIDTEYSEEYKNVTLTIQVGGKSDKLIQCYRLSGEGVKDLKPGDDITVEGTLKNYKGTIEFDKGCQFLGLGEKIDQSQILEAAYALEDGLAMNAPTALQGVISKIDTPWSDEYQNITVIMVVDGMEEKPVMAYRLSGEGAKDLKEGDLITVAGTIKNYKGTVEFDKGCKLIPNDSLKDAKTAMAAYGLEEGLSMNAPVTLTGVISTIDTEYSEEYKNITVTIVVGGMEDYKIQCYRLSGEGAKNLAVGQTITVNGTIKNYKGTIEFDKGCTLVPEM